MKITDMIISAILKKGIVYEARNWDMDIDVPIEVANSNGVPTDKNIKIRIKCEHMTIAIDKE